MGLLKAKTQFYLIVVSIIISLLGMAIAKQSGPPASAPNPTTTVQKLDALSQDSSNSPEMSNFLQRQKAAAEANQNGADALK